MSELIKRHMRPLERFLKMKDITDICINKPGEVWVYRQEGGWILYNDPAITTRDLLMLFDVIATLRGQKFGDEYPVLSTTLPIWEYRVEVQHPNVTATGVGVSIRTAKIQDKKPEDFFPSGENDKRERPPRHGNQDYVLETVRKMLAKDEHAQAARFLLKHEKCIIVAGGTSTGKTTCLNSLLACMEPLSRIVSIEDAQEVRVKQKNWLGIVKSKSGSDIGKATYKAIVNSCLRCRPDSIVFGELDIENSLPFLVLANSGHHGGLATVHANSPKDVSKAILTKLKMDGSDLDPTTVDELISTGVYAVAHLDSWVGRNGRLQKMGLLELLQ